MLELIISYFAFNLIAGFFLSCYYVKAEGSFNNSSECWMLLVFPVLGWGSWRYRVETESGAAVLFPERWYQLKYMKQLHWIFVGLMAAGVFFLGKTLFTWLHYSESISGSQSNPAAAGFGLLLDAGSFFVQIMILAIVVVLFAAVTVALIQVPQHLMSKIETDVYQQKLLEHMLNKKAKSDEP